MNIIQLYTAVAVFFLVLANLYVIGRSKAHEANNKILQLAIWVIINVPIWGRIWGWW